MNVFCEMKVIDYFKFSSGYIVLIGTIHPESQEVIGKCKADFYVGNKKIDTIDIIGEDTFSGPNKKIKENRRAVRALDNVMLNLDSLSEKSKRLVFYTE